MNQGTVKLFNSERGFGFIINDETKEEIFVHVTAITNEDVKVLEKGQKVTYDVETDPKSKRDRATNVTIV